MAEDPTKITWVAVPLSQAEFRRLNAEGPLTSPGTVWARMRELMGMHHSPLRIARESTEHRLLHPDGGFIFLPTVQTRRHD